MPIHDWTRVETSTFHSFHTVWIGLLTIELNKLLPPQFYAQAEQHMGRFVPDVLTLHSADPLTHPQLPVLPDNAGTVGVLTAPPRVSRTQKIPLSKRGGPRTLTIRHTSGHRIIALLEIVSPGNKDAESTVLEFVRKIEQALRTGVHVLIVDLFPPGSFDPQGVHANILARFEPIAYELPASDLRTFVSYSTGRELTAYLEHPAIGDDLPPMPLFLSEDRFLPLPLANTYNASVAGMPAFWRDVLVGA